MAAVSNDEGRHPRQTRPDGRPRHKGRITHASFINLQLSGRGPPYVPPPPPRPRPPGRDGSGPLSETSQTIRPLNGCVMGSPLAFPPIQSSRPRFHAKKRFGPVQGSEEEEGGGEGFFAFVNGRVSKGDKPTGWVGGMRVWLDIFGANGETRRQRRVGWCQPILSAPKSD